MIGTKGNKMFLLVLVITNILCTDLLGDVNRKNKAGPLWERFLDSKLLSLLFESHTGVPATLVA